jgi:hypothetical protein
MDSTPDQRGWAEAVGDLGGMQLIKGGIWGSHRRLVSPKPI